MNKQQLETILATLVRLEHNTKHSITNDEYWNIVALCQAVEAPQFITEYFATKANSAQSWQSSDKPSGVYQCAVALFWKVLIMTDIVIFKQSYGEFTTEKDGRLSGTVLIIKGKRKDGKYSVTHAYGSGKRIKKIYTVEQLQWVIFQMQKTEQFQKESAQKYENLMA